MNKNDLLNAMAEHSGLKKAEVEKALEAFISVVQVTLKNKDDVRLVGFGTFSVAERKATTGRNPKTGEPIEIAASTSAKFRAGKGLKDAVNNN